MFCRKLGILSAVIFGVIIGAQGVGAETARKPIPTLLIKGEIVEMDTSDTSSIQMVLQDRYEFQTPLFLDKTATITQGETELGISQLREGLEVEVEYNFDVNTAKRHVVSIQLTEEVPVNLTQPDADMESSPEPPPAPPVVMSAPEPAVEQTSMDEPDSEPAPESETAEPQS